MIAEPSPVSDPYLRLVLIGEFVEYTPLTDFNLALALIAGLTVALSLGAGVLRQRIYVVSEPMVAVAVGVLIGPLGFGLLELSRWGDPVSIIEQVARLTVALAVMSIALRLPETYFRQRAKAMAAILGPGMVAMWLVSALVVYAIFEFPIWVALLIGAIVTPTDPVLANTIVTGETAEENIPDRLRNFISGESGANDGGAYPFVFLAILALTRPPEIGVTEWLTRTLLWEVGGAVVLGLAVGASVGWIERVSSEEDRFPDRTSVLTVTVALTFATLGFVKLLGIDGILAVFVAGLAYKRLADPADEADEQRIQEVINRLFTYPVFVLFGMAIPWAEWVALGWRGVAVVVGVLLFRRLPMLLALRRVIPPIDRREATLFVGWFGPIGVAAIFYAALSVRETGLRTGWVVGTLVVAGSILAHGVTAVPATLAYGRLED